jgi:hypothetical protein
MMAVDYQTEFWQYGLLLLVLTGLSGTVQSFGSQAYGTWSDGTSSTHQSYGNMQFDTYQRGARTTSCTSRRF